MVPILFHKGNYRETSREIIGDLSHWFPPKAVLRDSNPFLKAFLWVPIPFKGIIGKI